MDEVITKRIHVSGLNPAITAKDLSDRLASFGTVKSIDGFGKLDAVGQPRKFAYATLETTRGKLARCMNLLSGVTWKGAKLRLGEAKPDYRERIAQEHAALKREAEENSEVPSRKRRRLPRGVQGVHALDMSLVTPENVSTRGGWRVSATGRLIRPIRMRPAHPLPEQLSAPKPEQGKSKAAKSKKRIRDPPTRARRRTIDPTKWGSQHLKGIFLENDAASVFIPRERVRFEHMAQQDSRLTTDLQKPSETDSESESEGDVVQGAEHLDSDVSDTSSRASLADFVPPPKAMTPPSVPKLALPVSEALDLAEEKSQSLGLLASLFGDKEQWCGPESIGSDAEDNAPRDDDDRSPSPAAANSVQAVDSAMDVDASLPAEEGLPAQQTILPSAASTKMKLKDLFAPREEDAGFSLLGHLDLDLELEDDVPFDIPTPAASGPTSSRPPAPAPPSVPHTAHIPSTSLDHSRPFFFPSDKAGPKGRVLDPTNWRTWFYRTDSLETISTRWEETKAELTAGWKRRHREAVKSRRRRGGGGAEAD